MSKLKYNKPLNSIVYVLKNNEIHKVILEKVKLSLNLEPIYNDWILESNIYPSLYSARRAIIKKILRNVKLIDTVNQDEN